MAAVALVVLIVVAFRRQVRAAHTPVEMTLLGLFVFALFNAMVSGDIAANRGVWVAIGMGLVALASPSGAEHGQRFPHDGRR